MGSCCSVRRELQSHRGKSPGDFLYGTMIAVNNPVLLTLKLFKRVDLTLCVFLPQYFLKGSLDCCSRCYQHSQFATSCVI